MGSNRRINGRTIFLLFLLWLYVLPALGSPLQAQDNPTTTPDAEGYIYVEVWPDDSLWAIAARAGLTIPELLELNDLDESVVLQPGDKLIVARVTPPATATSDIPTPTPLPPSATPTIERPRTALCIIAYNDANRDAQMGAGEMSRANVAFTIYNELEVVANYVTDGINEPFCLEDLSPGEYHVTRSKTQLETLTTEGDWALTLTEGSVLHLAFGSYEDNSQVLNPTLNADEQLRTRIALTPQATPTAVVENQSASVRTISLMVGLVIATFVLLAGLAVLTFIFVKRRQED
ncbi:MAG: LysM peptidoglycan-binding domain-containing protein [Candidatus Promineifilaceae bacterium]|jgi:hypothetical protein